MIDANNGGFTTIKEYNEKQKVKEGVDVISKKTIFSARYPKKAKILKNGEGPACSVLCYEIIP